MISRSCMFLDPDLHIAFVSKDAYFFVVLSLTIVSSFLYCLASMVDPGYLPKADLTSDAAASFNSSTKQPPKVQFPPLLSGYSCLRQPWNNWRQDYRARQRIFVV